MMRSTCFTFLLLTGTVLHAQNVGIGTANPQEKLHIAGNLRVDALAGTGNRLVGADANGSLFPLTAGTTGQVLTQTAGGPAWTSSSDWTTTGNAGTAPATNFIGTTDAADLAFRTSNTEAMRITAAGLVCVNGTGPWASDRFSVFSDLGQYAVNGYTNGAGSAGYFENYGTGTALRGISSGSSGSAASFYTSSPGPTGSLSPVVYMFNGGSSAPTLSLNSLIADGNAHGVFVEMNGGSANRGLLVDMDAANTGHGISVQHWGNAGSSLTLQNFSNTTAQSALMAHTNGLAPAVEGVNFNAAGTARTGYFRNFSAGLVPATFTNTVPVWGEGSGIRGGAFIAAGAVASTTCLQGFYSGPASNVDGVGVYGIFNGGVGYGYGVVGQGNWYGVFANGNLGGSGTKTFLIDHPQDPENQYLRHFSMESDEVLNLYRGTVTLDAQGEAVVELPDYFSLINAAPSYALTPVGGPAAVYVAQEINAAGEFRIAGGNAGQKICWVVYAQRNDPWMQQHAADREPVFPKRPHEQGSYLHPELYGQPAEKGRFYGNQVQPQLIAAPEHQAPVPAPQPQELPPSRAPR